MNRMFRRRRVTPGISTEALSNMEIGTPAVKEEKMVAVDMDLEKDLPTFPSASNENNEKAATESPTGGVKWNLENEEISTRKVSPVVEEANKEVSDLDAIAEALSSSILGTRNDLAVVSYAAHLSTISAIWIGTEPVPIPFLPPMAEKEGAWNLASLQKDRVRWILALIGGSLLMDMAVEAFLQWLEGKRGIPLRRVRKLVYSDWVSITIKMAINTMLIFSNVRPDRPIAHIGGSDEGVFPLAGSTLEKKCWGNV
ncbi:hypothetical protein HDU96_000984 [Phlyctochytrium bullatum]|nr:hypothetical protein HDU96_000984 [Phlyctochytrium bullatum]